MILAIVDRPRYGLLEHSEALVEFMGRHGGEGQMLYDRRLAIQAADWKVPFSIGGLLRRAARKEFGVLVLWSVGISYLLLPLVRILNSRARVIIVCHEPGGLRQRLKKRDHFWYSILVTAYERLFFPFAHDVVTPNEANSQPFGMSFAPLLFIEPVANVAAHRRHLVHLGRKSHSRSLDLFTEANCENLIEQAGGGLLFSFFPDGERKSSQDKEVLMRQALCVVNLYTVKHNQSGVTPDALRFGVPVIVSEFDAFATLINAYKAGIVLPKDGIAVDTVAAAVRAIRDDYATYSSGAARLFDLYFGSSGFERYWLPLLRPRSPATGAGPDFRSSGMP